MRKKGPAEEASLIEIWCREKGSRATDGNGNYAQFPSADPDRAAIGEIDFRFRAETGTCIADT